MQFDRFCKIKYIVSLSTPTYTLYVYVSFDIYLFPLGTRPPLPQGQTTDAGWKVRNSDKRGSLHQKVSIPNATEQSVIQRLAVLNFLNCFLPHKIVRWQKRARKTKLICKQWGAQHRRLCNSDLSTSVCLLIVGLVIYSELKKHVATLRLVR